MTGPPGQPWWARPGGAPLRGRPPIPPSHYEQPRTPPPPRQHTPPPQPPREPRPDDAKRSRRRTLLWAGAAIVAFEAVVLAAALSYFGYFDGGTVLDIRQAERGVVAILSDPINGYGANNVTAVRCNGGEDPEVKRGNSFVCDVTVNGAPRQVRVVFRDDAGTYEVDGPR